MNENGSQKRPCHLPYVAEGESGTAYLDTIFGASKVPYAYAWNRAYRREFLLKNELVFPESFEVSEDFHFNMNCYCKAASVSAADIPLYNYRIRAGSLTQIPSAGKVRVNIENKAYWYRKLQVPALADLFVSEVLELASLRQEEANSLLVLVKENKDIIAASKHGNYNLAKILFGALGYRKGALAYYRIRDIIQKLRNSQ